MAQISYEAPLRLPSGWIKTPPGQRSYDNNFSRTLTVTEALNYLEEEIHQLLPTGVATVYSSYDQMRNERLRRNLSNDTGASVMLRHPSGNALLACDKWASTEHNLYALSLAVRALRSFEYWGIAPLSKILPAFCEQKSSQGSGDGFSAPLPDWMQQLGLGPTATVEDANAVYRRRARELGEDQQGLLVLNHAIEQARRHLRS